MKKIILFLIIALNIGVIYGQTEGAYIIINSSKDIVETELNKIITFYTKGLSASEIDGFKNGLKHIQGLKLHFLTITDQQLKVANGKIEMVKTYDKNQLITLLNKYNIKEIVLNGKPKTLKEFFYKKDRGQTIIK